MQTNPTTLHNGINLPSTDPDTIAHKAGIGPDPSRNQPVAITLALRARNETRVVRTLRRFWGGRDA
jgi:hypothetical protein